MTIEREFKRGSQISDIFMHERKKEKEIENRNFDRIKIW